MLPAATGVAAVRLFLDSSNVRAWPGGVGQFKIGGNYAPTVTPQSAAKQRHDCSQVRGKDEQFCSSSCAAAVLLPLFCSSSFVAASLSGSVLLQELRHDCSLVQGDGA
jgi:hypothetical protein